MATDGDEVEDASDAVSTVSDPSPIDRPCFERRIALTARRTHA